MRRMQEYVVKGKDVFVGLEDSKRTWRLCVRSGGMVVHETTMPARYEVLRGYLRGRYPECRVRVMYEAGFGGFWLHDCLRVDGVECVVTPPHRVTEEKVNRVKTDKRDARRLAKNLEGDDYVSCWVPDREVREDRQVSRTLDQVDGEIKRTKNRVRRLLDFHGLNGDLPAGAWTRARYRRVRELELSPPLQRSVGVLLDMLEELEAHRVELLKRMKEISRKERYRRSVESKQSCPGVGWLTAIRLTLEWGEDMSRFRSGKGIGAFIGMVSSEYSTGEEVHRGSITRQGRGRVRAWVVQCAWRAIKIDPALLDKFMRVWRNSGSRKKAIVAVARMLVVRMRAVELSGQRYCLGVIE